MLSPSEAVGKNPSGWDAFLYSKCSENYNQKEQCQAEKEDLSLSVCLFS